MGAVFARIREEFHMRNMQRAANAIVLKPSDYAVLDEDDFGVPGLVAHEWVGPFVDVQAVGPLIMVHDGVFDPHKGIGHHPHRFNERLFYILEGAVDHDDALNGITGHMGTGDLGQLTEGARGMLHQEWNNTDGRARAFILVYGTEPIPPRAAFAALRDPEAPRYESAPGVRTKELVGPGAGLQLHGDVRLFTDDSLEPGSELRLDLGEDEGGLLFILQGEVALEGESLPSEAMALFPPASEEREVTVASPSGARVLRAVYGSGQGLVVRSADTLNE
jgi:redox-sensitive bicupin YhaK (pirin superfamily)